ncbi:MAG TPA: hypothetical protein VMM93_09760 [Vicinamibacterales bacterium]|nr:hypothetical protein [Vicinamibacterales bacterium]
MTTRLTALSALAASLTLTACGAGGAPPALAGTATPVYNKETGRLERLESDTNHDGRVDTIAHMDGVRLTFIEIDRDFDGRSDRWEYYRDAPGTAAAARAPDGRSVLERAEEANGHDDRVTRRVFYVDGVIARVEDDVDLDGRVDKWEVYEAGILRQMDLDTDGVGRATRRLVYDASGQVIRVEEDPDGDQQFTPVSPAGKGGGRS